MNNLISTKHLIFVSLVGPSETAKPQINYNWLKNGKFQPKFVTITFFLIKILRHFTMLSEKRLKISSFFNVSTLNK